MSVSEQLLNQSWVHSHEEDRGDEVVFRPSTYSFPPSRGRHGFSLHKNGTAVLTGPGPGDRNTSEPAAWRLDDLHTLVIQAHDGSTQVLRVTAATPDKLVMKRQASS